MKKKIIILIMIIPIILIFTTNLVITKVPVIVDVPVSSVDVIGKLNRIIDLAGATFNSDDFKLIVSISPQNAKANITYQLVEVENQKLASVEIKDGKVVPHSTGVVKIIVKAGDKSDVVTFWFTSSLPIFKLNENMTEDDVDLINFTTDLIELKQNEICDLTKYLPNEETFSTLFNMSKQEFIDNSSLKVIDNDILIIEDEFTWKILGKNLGTSNISVSYRYLLINQKGEISVKIKEITNKVVVISEEGVK